MGRDSFQTGLNWFTGSILFTMTPQVNILFIVEHIESTIFIKIMLLKRCPPFFFKTITLLFSAFITFLSEVPGTKPKPF